MTSVFWKELIKKLVRMLFPKIAGLKLWLLSKIAVYGGSHIYEYVSDIIRKIKRTNSQKDEIKELEDANKKGASVQEKEKIEKDFLNS